MKRYTLKAVGLAATAALALAACSGGDAETPAEGAATADPNADVTLNFTWWGNDDRAARYEEALDLFREDHPNITVQTSFQDFPNYWTARSTEAAGRSLPDVMQFDLSYLREYNENGHLLDLGEYVGDAIDTAEIDESLLASGELDGTQVGIPTSTNTLALFYHPALLEQTGVEAAGRGLHLGGVQRVHRGRLRRGRDHARRQPDLRRCRLHRTPSGSSSSGSCRRASRRSPRTASWASTRQDMLDVPRHQRGAARRQGRLPRRPRHPAPPARRLHGQRVRVRDLLGQLPRRATPPTRPTRTSRCSPCPPVTTARSRCSSSRPCCSRRAPTPSTRPRPRCSSTSSSTTPRSARSSAPRRASRPRRPSATR